MERHYGWVIVAIGTLMGCIGMGSLFSLAICLDSIATGTGWSRAGISASITVAFLAMGVGSFGWGWASDRHGPRIVGIASGAMPLYAVLARDYFSPRIMGTVFGAATMVSCLGMAAGPTVGGWIFDRFGSYAGMHFSSLAIGLGAVAIAFTFPPLPRMRPSHFPAAEARPFGSLRMVTAW
jgi:MFS family permease